MIKAGMDVARLNFSHGTHEEHRGYHERIRRLSGVIGKPVAVLQDLQGIKIRIGDVEEGALRLRRGQTVLLKPGEAPSSEGVIYISYPALLRDIRKGHRVLLDDGLIELKVTARRADALEARVKEGGVLGSRKGVNLPDSRISLSPFTDKDRDDLRFGTGLGVDSVALSFVIKADDVKAVKGWLREKGLCIPVIAKIEKPEALTGIDSILKASDGIMVARGDLGVEVPPEEVPLIQKELIRKANEACRVVITATQMLESMREHTRPTRAEAADVANAIIDGTDALMLSAETSTGRYPVQSVRMMRRIVESTEAGHIIPRRVFKGLFPDPDGDDRASLAIAEAAVRAAEDVRARCIVAFTRSGFTALLVSKCRPAVPVVAFTPHEAVMRQMSLFWGVRPLQMRPLSNTDEMVYEVEKSLIERRAARKGERIVIIASSPLHTQGKTNFMKVHRIGG